MRDLGNEHKSICIKKEKENCDNRRYKNPQLAQRKNKKNLKEKIDDGHEEKRK